MKQYENKTYSHKVDAKGIIVSVSDNWLSFAQENFGDDSCLPENVIGTYLLDHIHDPETKHLYELILQKVRKYGRQVSFSFRCDSPDKRRFLKLSVIPQKDDLIEFRSQIIKTELRDFVELMRSDIERSEKHLRICSMCKKIAISKTEWEEAEIVIQQMRLFELEVLPQLSHGLCQPCYNGAIAELDSLK
ncbi:MAG: hypothetical protein PVF37_18560 [Desulfobacterales bacterium]|jgi:hypothetical protein